MRMHYGFNIILDELIEKLRIIGINPLEGMDSIQFSAYKQYF